MIYIANQKKKTYNQFTLILALNKGSPVNSLRLENWILLKAFELLEGCSSGFLNCIVGEMEVDMLAPSTHQ